MNESKKKNRKNNSMNESLKIDVNLISVGQKERSSESKIRKYVWNEKEKYYKETETCQPREIDSSSDTYVKAKHVHNVVKKGKRKQKNDETINEKATFFFIIINIVGPSAGAKYV